MVLKIGTMQPKSLDTDEHFKIASWIMIASQISLNEVPTIQSDIFLRVVSPQNIRKCIPLRILLS